MGKWSREATSLLIEEVKKLPFLYDPSDKKYHDRQARRAAMSDIAVLLSGIRPETTSEEVRIRWSALRSAFQGSMSKMKRRMNGTLASEFTKVWFFDEMLFLCKIRPARVGGICTTKEGADILNNSNQNEDFYHSVTVGEETLDEYAGENIVAEIPDSEISRIEGCGMNFHGGHFLRGNFQEENLQRDTMQRGSVQREDLRRENLPRENTQEVDRVTRVDLGSRRKRNHDGGFYHTLDFAVKKLMDRSTEDADFVFGKLVAHELKSLKSPALRKKLKHKILQDIIEVQNLQDES
ncbi:uncharacterized protein [Hetaerina americana]|uniref:uncharacterized protein n=1 Tax=Hetaerina americana TaxID=62018 RepID=UPI003A7F2B51